MDRNPSMLALAAALAASMTLGARAIALEAESSPDVSELIKRIEQLEAENTRQRGEIDDLRAATNENWLTEQRAGEIRALVADVLADSETRSSLQGNGMTAGWADGFFLASQDGRFKLGIDGLMQIRFVYSGHDQPDRHRMGFENTRTQLTFRGHAFSPDLTYLVRGGFSRDGGGGGNISNGEVRGGDFLLFDAFVRWHFSNEWSLRFGQFKLPFNREELVASQYQLLVERSLVSEAMRLGRSQGIEIQYNDERLNWLFAVSDGADDDLGQAGTLIGTTPPNTPALDEDSEFSFTTRLEGLLAGDWAQFEDMTSPPGEDMAMLLGVAGHVQQTEYGSGTFGIRNENWLVTGTIDFSAEWGGASLFSSFTYDYVDSAAIGIFDIYGFVIQGGLYVTPKAEIFSRFEYGRLDGENVVFSDLYLATFGMNYYFDGHDVKWTTDLGFGISQLESVWRSDIAGWRAEIEGAEPQIVFRTQFQLMF